MSLALFVASNENLGTDAWREARAPCRCSICSRYTPDIGNTAAAVAVGDGPILKEHRWPGAWAHEPAYETASSLLLVSVSLFDSRSYQSGDDTEEV